MREVAVLGVGQSLFGKFPEKSIEELGREAVFTQHTYNICQKLDLNSRASRPPESANWVFSPAVSRPG